MRLAHLHPDELDERQRALYDVLASGPRRTVHATLPPGVGMVDDDGRLLGPFNAMLHHPVVGRAVQEVGRVLRFEGVLTARARELVILEVAASERSDFEWVAHDAIAASEGVNRATIDAIGRGEAVTLADPAEDAVVALAHALVTTGDADDATFERARAAVGEQAVYEVSTLVGVYQLLAQQLRLFRVPAPVGPWSST